MQLRIKLSITDKDMHGSSAVSTLATANKCYGDTFGIQLLKLILPSDSQQLLPWLLVKVGGHCHDCYWRSKVTAMTAGEGQRSLPWLLVKVNSHRHGCQWRSKVLSNSEYLHTLVIADGYPVWLCWWPLYLVDLPWCSISQDRVLYGTGHLLDVPDQCLVVIRWKHNKSQLQACHFQTAEYEVDVVNVSEACNGYSEREQEVAVSEACNGDSVQEVALSQGCKWWPWAVSKK